MEGKVEHLNVGFVKSEFGVKPPRFVPNEKSGQRHGLVFVNEAKLKRRLHQLRSHALGAKGLFHLGSE